ncbi:MAG: hypothetical protein OEL88_16665 [Sterolibacteriaceae bacterium MAG5]|nr:hypothetical protein [Candidatus Nitricoxidireducens bremensis]
MKRDIAALGGLYLRWHSARELDALESLLAACGLDDKVYLTPCRAHDGHSVHLQLDPGVAAAWMPDHDTTRWAADFGLDTAGCVGDLEIEILAALLASPIPLDFPSVAELVAGVHMRRNIVLAGRRTSMDFHTSEAERPADCWCCDEENGFTVRPGCGLVDALRKATQPDLSGRLYAFSCYRATEYVMLLGIAEELAVCNPDLLARLQRQCETRVIRSGQFHDVFLREYGSQDHPLPPFYYVPGDRVWFRNPDERSSDVIGFEGSWVLYLGGGLFTNFWKRDQPYTLDAKCLEIYHWRHGVRYGADGQLVMDEAIVEDRVADSLADGEASLRILAEMKRWREPKGCYGNGGCIDTTRESPRWVCPETSDLVLPLH